MRIFGWGIFLLTVIALALTFSPVAAAPVTTKEQALSLAQAFAKRLGWQMSNNLSPHISPPEPINHNCWGITFAPPEDKFDLRFSFTVNAAIGRVSSACDYRALRLAMEQPVQNVAFDEAIALTYAQAYLAKAEVSLTDHQLVKNLPWRDLGTKRVINWIVEYRRAYKGVLFEEDGAVLILSPRDGSLIKFSYYDSSPPLPETTEASLTKEMVIAIADNYLFTKEKVHADATEEPQLLITTRLNKTTKQNESRLCWHIMVKWQKGKRGLCLIIDDQSKTVVGTYFALSINTP